MVPGGVHKDRRRKGVAEKQHAPFIQLQFIGLRLQSGRIDLRDFFFRGTLSVHWLGVASNRRAFIVEWLEKRPVFSGIRNHYGS